jgi:hypothetical protein
VTGDAVCVCLETVPVMTIACSPFGVGVVCDALAPLPGAGGCRSGDVGDWDVVFCGAVVAGGVGGGAASAA